MSTTIRFVESTVIREKSRKVRVPGMPAWSSHGYRDYAPEQTMFDFAPTQVERTIDVTVDIGSWGQCDLWHDGEIVAWFDVADGWQLDPAVSDTVLSLAVPLEITRACLARRRACAASYILRIANNPNETAPGQAQDQVDDEMRALDVTMGEYAERYALA